MALSEFLAEIDNDFTTREVVKNRIMQTPGRDLIYLHFVSCGRELSFIPLKTMLLNFLTHAGSFIKGFKTQVSLDLLISTRAQ